MNECHLSIIYIYIICSVPSISELLRGKIGRVHHATQSFDYAECTPCIELYIVVLVQVLQLVIVDVLLPNPGPGAVVEACFAMNLHKAVDVLCLHRMRFIGKQHLLHFVVFFSAPGAAVPDFRWPSHKTMLTVHVKICL